MGLPKCPFLTRGYEIAKEKADLKYQNCVCTEDERKEYVDKYIEEEMLKVNQARLADQLDKLTAQRLLEKDRSKTTSNSSDKKTGTVHVVKRGRKFGKSKKSKSRNKDRFDNKLIMDEKSGVVELTAVTIFPNVGGEDGETIVGTLQSHVNGFLYETSGSDSNVIFLYKDVKDAFFQVEDEKKMPPLLHFHLALPIKVGNEMTEDIQFRLVPTPVGRRRSDDDSNKIMKEKQTGDLGHYEDLKVFVFKVQDKMSCLPLSHYPFDALDKMHEFHGALPSKAPSVFGLTLFSLVGLADKPFVVVNLLDIEIVNLAKLGPEEIDMTVVFKDFKRVPLQINSIPSHSLNDIKRCLDFRNVKYYVNAENPDCWENRVKKIAAFPEMFIKQGGWKFFDLEDAETLSYYNCDKGSEVDKCNSDEEVYYCYNSEGSLVVINSSDIEA